MTSAPNQQQKVDLLYLSAIKPRSCQFWSFGASEGLRGRFPGPRKDLGSPTTRPERGKTVVRSMKTPILSHFEHTSPSCPRSKTILRSSAYQQNGLIIRKTSAQSRNDFVFSRRNRTNFNNLFLSHIWDVRRGTNSRVGVRSAQR